MEASIRKKELNNNLTNLLKKYDKFNFLKLKSLWYWCGKIGKTILKKYRGVKLGQIGTEWDKFGTFQDFGLLSCQIWAHIWYPWKKPYMWKSFKKKVFWLKWTIWWGYPKNEATMFYVPETEKHYRLLSFILEQWFQHFSTIFTPKSNWSTF